jgi:hypothetical protein
MSTTFIVRTGNPPALNDTLQVLPGVRASVVDDTWNSDERTCHVRVDGDEGFFRFAMANQGYGDVLGEVNA